MADGAYTEAEAATEIVLAVLQSPDSAQATTLYMNRHETHEISFNSFTREYELMESRSGENVFTSESLATVALEAVRLELWIEE